MYLRERERERERKGVASGVVSGENMYAYSTKRVMLSKDSNGGGRIKIQLIMEGRVGSFIKLIFLSHLFLSLDLNSLSHSCSSKQIHAIFWRLLFSLVPSFVPGHHYLPARVNIYTDPLV